MGEHFCNYTIGWNSDFTAVRCDKPAPIKHENGWLCAEHYDDMEASFTRAADGYYHYEFGCDLGDELPETFPPDPEDGLWD